MSTVSWPTEVVEKIMEMFTVPELNSCLMELAGSTVGSGGTALNVNIS